LQGPGVWRSSLSKCLVEERIQIVDRLLFVLIK
jgi:hypothetical protein